MTTTSTCRVYGSDCPICKSGTLQDMLCNTPSTPEVKVKLLSPNATLTRATAGASGFDLHLSDPAFIMAGEVRTLPVGIALEIPPGYEGQIRPRSGLSRMGVNVAFGTLDSDYRGALGVIVTNNSGGPLRWDAGMRIAQLVFVPVVIPTLTIVEDLGTTDRGSGGFGSTGV